MKPKKKALALGVAACLVAIVAVLIASNSPSSATVLGVAALVVGALLAQSASLLINLSSSALDKTVEAPEEYVPQRNPYLHKDTRELEILLASNRAINVVGRDEDLRKLRNWLYESETVSVRVITGKGGSGKTRLALQLLDELPKDWIGGILVTSATPSKTWPQDKLLVVDYAASSIGTIGPWLKSLRSVQDGPKLRVLLLERGADPNLGWFQRLRDFVDVPMAEPIEPIGHPSYRRKILSETLRVMGSSLDVPAAGQNPQFDNRLADGYGWYNPTPLSLHGNGSLCRLNDAVTEQLGVSKTPVST